MINEAKKNDMLLSEYINRAVQEKINVNHLTESQEQFANTFDYIFKSTYEPYFKREMVMFNKINFNLNWIIRILNLLLKHIKIPQDKEEVLTSFIDHPILDIASDEVLKEIRNNKHKKESENEFE